MKKVEFWYFKIEHPKGDIEICCYGGSDKYTQEEATQKMKELCELRGWKFIGVHKD